MRNTEIKPNVILKQISERSGVSIAVLCSRTQTREVADLRKAYYVLGHEFTNLSFASIGVGINREHSTVIVGMKGFDNLKGTKGFKAGKVYDEIVNEFRTGNCKS